jgi:hypothetical protein
MLNILLNRYYINNASRSIAVGGMQEKVYSVMAKANIGEAPASGVSVSLRGQEHHTHLQRELQGIWTRHLIKEEEQKYCESNFCKNN